MALVSHRMSLLVSWLLQRTWLGLKTRRFETARMVCLFFLFETLSRRGGFLVFRSGVTVMRIGRTLLVFNPIHFRAFEENVGLSFWPSEILLSVLLGKRERFLRGSYMRNQLARLFAGWRRSALLMFKSI